MMDVRMGLVVWAVLTREAAAELLSVAYSTISIADVALALGFAQQEETLQCASDFVQYWRVFFSFSDG